MPRIGKVAGIDLEAPRLSLVTDHGVEQRVIGRAKGIGAIP
jgi:hypothetical protein